jgi:hypothetical protein
MKSGVLFGLFFVLALVVGTALWARPQDQRTLFIVAGAVVVANLATALVLSAGARAELRARQALATADAEAERRRWRADNGLDEEEVPESTT